MNIQSTYIYANLHFGRSGEEVQDNKNWTIQKIKNCELHRLRKRVNLTFSALKIFTINFFFHLKLKCQIAF